MGVALPADSEIWGPGTARENKNGFMGKSKKSDPRRSGVFG